MKLLLDTHTFLWYYSGSTELSASARKLIEDERNDYWVSITTLWEISIKHSIGKLDLDKPFEALCKDAVNKGFSFLSVDVAHIIKSATLPLHHRDPFDRIIIAQALTEGMYLVSKDEIMDDYLLSEAVSRLW